MLHPTPLDYVAHTMATLTEPIRTMSEDETSRAPSSHAGEKILNEAFEEPAQHIHAKTIILLIVGMQSHRTGGLLMDSRLSSASISCKLST